MELSRSRSPTVCLGQKEEVLYFILLLTKISSQLIFLFYSPELSADVLSLERSADSHPALQRDKHREVDRAALTEHPHLKKRPVIKEETESHERDLGRDSPINFLKGKQLFPSTSVYSLQHLF